jgi:putative oxidoreductase
MKLCEPNTHKLHCLFKTYQRLTSCTTPLLTSLALLFLRLIMAWEFWESGLEKLHGTNWFEDISHKFPWPIRLLPVHLNWTIATYAELIGAILVLLGVATRLSAFSLFIITYVAIHAVHWPDMWANLSDLLQGYTITDEGHGNFKLPLLYLAILFVLIAQGGGTFSIDRLLSRCIKRRTIQNK